jgi:hypothetical protein
VRREEADVLRRGPVAGHLVQSQSSNGAVDVTHACTEQRRECGAAVDILEVREREGSDQNVLRVETGHAGDGSGWV